jgi:hypothetical protein
MIELSHQILSTQVRISLQHLHRLMTADRGDLLVRKSCFHKPAYGFMSEVVEADIREALFTLDIQPHRIELVGVAFAITSGLTVEDQVCVFRADRMI